MIVSREEFLLVLKKWKNSSAKVIAVLSHGGSETADPLASAFILELPATVAGCNESFFVLGSKDTGLLSVGIEGAELNFGTDADLDPAFAQFVSASAKVDEMAFVLLPSGLKLFLGTFK